MITLIEARLRAGLALGARRLAGMLCMAVGAAFLTVAGWVALSAAYDTIVAALVIGGIYLVAGVLLAFLPQRRVVRTRRAMGATDFAALTEAFLAGRSAGRTMRGG